MPEKWVCNHGRTPTSNSWGWSFEQGQALSLDIEGGVSKQGVKMFGDIGRAAYG
jgi:hypothetical protein